MGIKFNTQVKPSTYIWILCGWYQYLWKLIGKAFAYLSSYLEIINIYDLITAFVDLIRPIISIIKSPYYFVKGYMSVAFLYDHPYMITTGSIILILGIGYLKYHYF